MKPVLATLLLASLLCAETKYVGKTILAYPSAEGEQKYQGKILPTTELKVLQEKDDKALVSVTGWIQDGVSRVIYYSKGERIISAAFSKKAKYDLKKFESETINGKVWQKVTATTWIENKNLDKSKDELYAEALNIYESNCTVCHPAPEVGHFTANQWPQIVKDMGSRTAIEKENILLLTQYLQKHTSH